VIRRALTLLLAVTFLAGCPGLDPMQRQGKYKAYQASPYYADGLAMRTPPAGTVPYGSVGDPALQRGIGEDGKPLARSPLPFTPQLLAAGRKKFDIHCAVCHGLVGDGQSQVALNMSLRRPADLHLYRDVPDGYLYQVISQGFGLMPAYSSELTPEERWAVVGYVRALQLSQHASAAQVPAETLKQLPGATR
jgi:mono/diheme cytochrome c family protein